MMSGELEELGEEVDDNVKSISGMQTSILNLTHGKVNIFEDDGSFKSTYDIMKEISDIYYDLSDINRASLLETIAGKNRASDVQSLINGWSQAEKATQSAYDAEGSAMDEYSIHMDTVQASLNELSSAWQEFSNTFLKSDFLKGAIDGVTGLVNILTKLIDTFGAFGVIGVGLIGKGLWDYFTRGKKSITDVANSLETLTEVISNQTNETNKSTEANLANAESEKVETSANIENATSEVAETASTTASTEADKKEIATNIANAESEKVETSANIENATSEAIEASATIGNASGKTGGIFSKLASGAKSLLGFAKAHPVITATTVAIGALGASYIYQKKKAEELSVEVDELTDSYQQNYEQLKKLQSNYDTSNESSMISRYGKLSKGVDGLGRNLSLTADEYSEYQGIVNQIADQIPSLISGYDSQGNAILSCKGNVEELTKAYEDLIHAQNNEILSKAKDIENDFKNVVKEAKSDNDGFLGLGTKLSSDTAKVYKDILNSKDSIDAFNKAINDKDTWESGIRLQGQDIKALADLLEETEFEREGNWLNPEADEEYVKRAFKENKNVVKRVIDDFYADLETETKAQKNVAQIVLSEAFDVSNEDYENISEGMRNIAQQTVNSLDYDFFEKLSEKGKTVTQWTTEMLNQLNSISKDDNAEIETAFDLQTKFNGGKISYGEYVKSLKDVEATINGLDLKQTAKNQLKLDLNIDEVTNQYNALKNRLTSDEYEIQLDTKTAESWLSSLSSEEVKVTLSFINSNDADFNNALQKYKDVLDEAEKAGVDFSKTVYGNIDTNARQVLEWNSENLAKYKDELMSFEPETSQWSNVKKEYEDTISTVMGMWDTFEIDGKGVDIAFSPMLQTDNGAKVLSSGTVNSYIGKLIEKATEDNKWTNEELLKLDSEGIEIDGQKIKGILADIGDTAEATSMQMHFIGKDGALALAKSEIFDMVEKEAKLNEALNYTIAIDVETEGLTAFNTAMAESVSGAGLSSASIASLKSRYAELEAEGYNLSAMFEETSNGIHLNREAVSELEQAYAEQKLSETDNQLNVLKSRYDELTTEINNCTDASERASLYTEQQTIIDKINDLGTLASQYKGVVSAYNQWQNAESAGQERDMYEGILQGFENVKDEISRGWIDDGTTEFLELLTGKTDLASKSGAELKKVYDDLDNTIKNTTYSVRDFFTVDGDGNSTNTGVYNFLDAIGQLEEEKFGGKDVVQRDKSGNIIGFDFELVGGDKVIADALGISEELVQIMVRASDDAGFVVNLEGAYTQLADLKNEAELAKNSLIDLKENGLKELKDTDVNFNLTAEGDDLVAEQDKAVKLLNKFKKGGKIDLTMDGAQEALDIAEYLTIKLDDLTEPRFMQIDTSTVEKDLQEPIEKIKEIGGLCKEKHLVSLTGDTKELKEVQSEINKTAKEIEDLDPEIKPRIGIDKKWNAKTIAEKIDKGEIEIPASLEVDVQISDNLKDMRLMMMEQLGLITKDEVKLKIGYDIDDSIVDELTDEQKEVVVKYFAEHEDIDNYTPEEKQAIVEYLTDTGEPDNWTPEQKEAIAKFIKDSSEPDNYDPENPEATVVYDKDSKIPDNYDPDKNGTVTFKKDSSVIDSWKPVVTGLAKFTLSMIVPPSIRSALSKLGIAIVDGTSHVNGTAFANGTIRNGKAFVKGKRGDWSIGSSGTALGGELGQETVVRDGKFFTIGDDGAEFFQYKKGDIIFNHKNLWYCLVTSN